MDSVHFRLPHNITQIMDTAAEYGIFPSRSQGLREAATYAILDNLPVEKSLCKDSSPTQYIYDHLVIFHDIVKEFKYNADHMIQESLAGNSIPLEEFRCRIGNLVATFPIFWQSYLWETLRKIPEFRVIEQCLRMESNT